MNPQWRWVTNADPRNGDALKNACDKYKPTSPCQPVLGSSRWPGDSSSTNDPGEPQPCSQGQIGVYIARTDWVRWFLRVNPRLGTPEAAERLADEVIEKTPLEGYSFR